MTLARDVIDLPLNGGIDQGRSKYLPVPFHKVTNFYFNKFGALEKRAGLQSMTDATTVPTFGTPIDAVGVAGPELVALGTRAEDSAASPGEAGPYLWSYSSSASAWAPKTSVPGLSVERLPCVRGETDLDDGVQVARIGSVEMAIWRVGTVCYGRIVDRATGAVLLDNVQLVNNGLSGPAGKYILFPCGGVFTVVYLSSVTALQLRRSTIHPTTLAVNSANVGAAYGGAVSQWDAIPTVTGKWAVAVLSGGFAGDVVTRRINNATAGVDAFVAELGRAGGTVSLGFRPGYGYLLLAWDDRTDVRAKHYVESTLVTALADWLVEPVASFVNIYGLAAQIDDQNRSFVLIPSLGAGSNPGFSFRAFDTLGAALMTTRRVWWVQPQCKPFRLDGGLFVLVAASYLTPFSPGRSFGYAVLNLTRHFDDVGTDYPVALEGLVAPLDGYGLDQATAGIHHAWIEPVDGVAPVGVLVFGAGTAVTSTDPRAWADTVEFHASKRRDGVWTFGYAGGLLHSTGALVTQYDGQAAVEAAFLEPPQLVGSITPTYGGSGLLAAASPNLYTYYLAWEWIDAKGSAHRSRLSEPFSYDLVPGGGPRATLQFNVKCSSIMRRALASDGDANRVRLVVYRSLANGLVYYRNAWSSSNVNDPGAATISYTDTADDAALLASLRGKIYTDGGILEWQTPPAARHVQVSGGRTWITSAEAPEVWPSNEQLQGEAPSFSSLTRITLDDASSKVVGTGWLDGLLVIFTESQIYVLDASAGPGATGVPPWPRPQAIQTSGGCVSGRSIVSFKDGVFFRAVDTFKILTRGRELLNVGEAVRVLTDAYPTVLDAVLDAARERVLFLVAGAAETRVLCYDYGHTGPDGSGSWTDWAFAEETDLTRLAVWSGGVVASYAAQPGVLREATGANPGWDNLGGSPEWVTGTVETPWIYLAALGGYQRAWRLVLELERLGGHGLQVNVFVDGEETTPVQTETWSSADISALQGLPRERIVMGLKVQKCSSLKVRISDVAPAVATVESPTGFRYHRLGVEIGRKRGVEKAEKANTR